MTTKTHAILIALACSPLLTSCESVQYVKSELSGTAKPDGGVQEAVPPSKTYNSTPQALRRAALAVLDEQGYVYEENASSGTIKTEPKPLTDTSKFRFTGASYYAKVFIKLEGATITYRAKFDKTSNLTMPEQNVEFPEKENEMRKGFFAALDRRLPSTITLQPVGAQVLSPASENEPARTESAARSGIAAPMSIAEMQRILLDLGYQPGLADGVNGRRTVDALRKFQQASKLQATGTLDAETIAKLRSARMTK